MIAAEDPCMPFARLLLQSQQQDSSYMQVIENDAGQHGQGP